MKYFKYFFLITAFGAILFWRWQVVSERDYIFESEISKTVIFEGLVVDEPDVRESATRLVVEPDNSRERVIVTTALYPEYNYGDRLKVSGKIQLPENFETDTGKEFDYVNYLAKEKIYYQIFRPGITVIGRNEGFWLQEKLFNLKQWFLGNLSRAIPEPEASLAGGLVVGAKQGLSKELQDDFRTVGLSHIVVLSGQNLSIIADVVFKYLSFLPFKTAIGASGILIFLFALMAGGGASLLRATIMAMIVLLARASGRIYDAGRALAVTILFMLIWNPRLAFYDLGFQLSVLSTIGVIYGVPIFNYYLRFIPERFYLRETISTTFAAQIAVLPWIAYKIGNISLIAPVVNVLVVPLVPVIMFLVFLSGVLGFIPFLPLPLIWLADFGLSYVIFITELFARLSFASITIASLPIILVVLSYVGIVWLMYRVYKHAKL